MRMQLFLFFLRWEIIFHEGKDIPWHALVTKFQEMAAKDLAPGTIAGTLIIYIFGIFYFAWSD